MNELTLQGYDVKRWSPSPTIAQTPAWYSKLMCNHLGVAKPILANALEAIHQAPEWEGVLAFNEFKHTTMLIGAPPWHEDEEFEPRDWTEQDDLRANIWFQVNHLNVTLEITRQAVEAAAGFNRVHPVRNYLNDLQWDGTLRISAWLERYFGAEPTEYVSAVGRLFLISGVARIMLPGAKVDTMLILEGAQGLGKSTGLKTLFGEKWFADEIGPLGSKDAAMQIHGVWAIEMSELDAMTKAEAKETKAFLSRSTDHFRPPYGKRTIDSPRQCIFAGTTNTQAYLKDETGGRRFWPVRVTKCDIAALRTDRDQLWAEAVHEYKNGAAWWFEDAKLVAAAAEEQADRYVSDPWDEKVAAFVSVRNEVSLAEILDTCLGIEAKYQGQMELNRVSRIVRGLGWVKFRKRDGKRVVHRYKREGGELAGDDGLIAPAGGMFDLKSNLATGTKMLLPVTSVPTQEKISDEDSDDFLFEGLEQLKGEQV